MTSPALIRESDATRLARVAKREGVRVVVKVGTAEITIIPETPVTDTTRLDAKRRPPL